MKNHRSKFGEAITNWLIVYPLITLLLWLLNPLMVTWPLPAKTLLVTSVVVPIMSFWAMPMAFSAYDWINERSSRTNRDIPLNNTGN